MKPLEGVAFAIVPVLCFAAGISVGLSSAGRDELLVLDVGQGDCAILRHDGVTIAVDDGPARQSLPAARAALRREGIEQVDLVLLSHPDADHVSGTPDVIRQNPNVRIAISSEFESFPKMLQDLKTWGVSKSSVIWLPRRSRVRLGDEDLEIECPPLRPKADDNAGSMFIHATLAGATVDFSGDAPSSVELAETPDEDWRADILHVGHHGSKTATSEGWLEAVRPRIAVISCGKNNPYGHPHKSVLDRLAAHHIKVCRTDQEGDLVFAAEKGHFVRVH